MDGFEVLYISSRYSQSFSTPRLARRADASKLHASSS